MNQSEKSAGILLPIFSLPSPYGIGDFGPQAYQFVDKLKRAHQNIWSVLPHTPTGYGNSPYQPSSAFAGNPYFVSPEILKEEGWISQDEINSVHLLNPKNDIDYGDLFQKRFQMLKIAHKNWKNQNQNHNPEYLSFCAKNHAWLDDYALFMAIKEKNSFKDWPNWEKGLRQREPTALSEFKRNNLESVDFWKFTQFQFFKQWNKLKAYTKSQGIQMMGDLPFYIGVDSVDVWKEPEMFNTTREGKIKVQAGVPNDQGEPIIWGNPCYNWRKMKQNNYSWFLNRFKQMSDMYDIVRLDHANGFSEYYGIMGDLKPVGRWTLGPEKDKNSLLDKIDALAKKKNTRVVLEDLGHNTLRSKKLFSKLDWDRMRVFLFTFNWKYGMQDMHIPELYTPNMTVYTGTHDNETIEGFISHQRPDYLIGIQKYLGVDQKYALRWAAIKKLYMSTASRVVLPIQDIMGLDNHAVICDRSDYNVSWRWRLNSLSDFSSTAQNKIRHLSIQSRRSHHLKEGKNYE